MAEVPQKAPKLRYIKLWTDSPFTSKPPPDSGPEAVNPLSDYALGGISPIKGGYRITLLNRKKPDERTIVESDDTSSGFKILTVNRMAGNPLGTTVRLASGSSVGVVAFDEKLLTLKAAAKPNTPQQNQPGAVPPGQQPPVPTSAPPENNPGQRQPRPRVIAPPSGTPSTNGQQQRQQSNQNGRQRQNLR